MKRLIWSIIFILSAVLLNAQTKTLIKTSNKVFDKLIIDKALEKKMAVVDYERINIETDAILTNKAVLEFFGYKITVYEQKLEVRGLKNYSWLAKGSNNMTFFILTVLEDDIQGVINTGTEMFKIETIDNKYFITKIDQSKYPEETCNKLQTYTNQNRIVNNNFSPNNSGGGYKFISGEPFTCRLRILVLYTPAAVSANTATSDIQNTIQLAVDEMTQSFINSSINREVELVYVGVTDYESVDYGTDAEVFAEDGDGEIDEVHNLRRKHQADVCVLIVDNETGCGRARVLKASAEYAFCVVHVNCATGNYSFAHEIGHLIGCQHHPNDPTDSDVTAAYPSAHGFKSPNDDWRTIMAYPCPGGCTRIPFWSNPNISFAGNTMGTTVTHNNTAMIEDKFPNVMSLLQPEDALLLEQIDVIADDADIIANKEIETNGSVEISPTQSYSFRAGEKITFKPGFKVQAGTSSQFVAEIVEVSECGEPDGEEADYGLGEDITMDILKQPLSFELFPNPANEIITISYKSIENNVVSISVTDFVGKEYLKLEKVILLDNELEKTLNISNLSSGIYFMTIYTNKGKLTKKFYKQ